MQLTEIVELSCIKVPLKAADKNQAITELMDLLDQNGKLKDYQVVLKAVVDREAVRSTGVGQGFAIPHGKTSGVDHLVMALGKTEKPIDFDSIDGQPVTMIILLLSPADQTGPHIQAIARISRLMTDKDLRRQLWSSSSAQQIYQHITDHENKSSPKAL
jgi:fructose-specific phosphotransferase system IIA component